ncbi:MAG TPA: hypothetical protein VHS28_02675, partial [Chloroflexota bacterium]|nr:hypothetical protein [Chloroflexota bacterium]
MATACRCFQRSPSRVFLLQSIVAVAAALFVFGWQQEVGSAYSPWWVQNHQETQLWSGVDSNAVSFASVPQWGYYMVVSPQVGTRLYVFNPLTRNYAYVEAAAVGPSLAPPASYLSSLATGSDGAAGVPFSPWWVQNHKETQLWSGPDGRAVSFGRVPQWSKFQVAKPQSGARLLVWNPSTDDYAYIDASVVGPSGAPIRVASSSGTESVAAATPGGASDEGALQPGRKGPALPADFEAWWVANFREADLWAGPDAGGRSLWAIPQFRRFMVVEPQSGSRLKVWSPEKDVVGYIDAR